jgi:T-complex protein 1 subunit alpha
MEFKSGKQGMTTSNDSFQKNKIKVCNWLYDLLKTSLGPISSDKMIIDNLGNITVTNDGASILKRIETDDPISKILIELSLQQDAEIGDGTTSIIIITVELLRRAQNLISEGTHPSIIISAYRLAMCHSCFLLKNNLSISSKNLTLKTLVNAAKTSLSSKISGVNANKFAVIALQAVKSVKTCDSGRQRIFCQIKAIDFVKIPGSGINKSKLVDGYVLKTHKTSVSFPTQVSPARILCLNQDIRRLSNKIGIQVESDKIDNIQNIIRKELDMLVNLTNQILSCGANVILTTKGIDDLPSKIIAKNGSIGVRRINLENLKKISNACGGKISIFRSKKISQKFYEKVLLGKAEEIFEENVAGTEILILRGCRFARGGSIVLRGPTEFLIDEITRSLMDAINMVKKAIEGNKLVPGGGAVETAIYTSLVNLADSISSREQLPILQFGEALLEIPKTLLSNSGLEKDDLLDKLRIIHRAALENGNKKYLQFGLDLFEKKIQNNFTNGIIEPTISKIRSLQIATEAAISILRIDDFILSKNEQVN